MTALTQSPQMISFPNFIRKSEQSPRSLDGAFPPFKIEHRYKSVYERAGFDVNRGGNNSDTKSITSRKTSRHVSNNSTKNVSRLQNDSTSFTNADSPVLQKNRTPSFPPDSSNMKNNSPTASSHSSKSSSVNSNFTNPKSTSSHSTFGNADEFSPVFQQPLTTGSSTTTFFNDNESSQKPDRYQPPLIYKNTTTDPITSEAVQDQDQFDFSPSSNHSRNQKNLRLDLSNNDSISETQSLLGITKVESQQRTITNHSMHSSGSNISAKTDKQAEPEQNPIIRINDEEDQAAQQMTTQQHNDKYDAYYQQNVQISPPVVKNNGAAIEKFDPRKQRSIRGQPKNNVQFQQHEQQQRDPYPPSGQQMRNMSVNGQPRNMSPTDMHHPPQPNHHHNNNNPELYSPKFGANGPQVQHSPMMSLNSPVSAYRPLHHPQSPSLPRGFQPNQPLPQQQAVYIPFNHHQHRQQAPGGYYNQSKASTEPPRTTRQPATYSQIRDDKLSSALSEFRNDIENHKNGANRSSTNSNSSLGDEVPSSAPPSDLKLLKNDSKEEFSNENTRFSYGNNMNSGMDGTSKGFDPSTQFKNFTNQQVAKDANLNNEYAEFLASQNEYTTSPIKEFKNNSHLSMVSSILSKASGNSEEDEIERELERQLQSLKMSGSSIDIANAESNKYRNSFSYGNNGGLIPLFNIQDVDEVPEGETEEERTKPLTISGNNSFIELKEIVAEELNTDSTGPLATHSSTESNEELKEKDVQVFEQQQGYGKQVQFESPNRQNETFNDEEIVDEIPEIEEEEDEEIVRPLSPKTHSIEEELESMNFQISQTDESPSVYIQESFPSSTIQDELEHEEESVQDRSFTLPPESMYPIQDPILEQPQYQPQQFGKQVPYPIKEFSPESMEQDHNHFDEPQLYAPGTGPCRTCNVTIDSNSRIKHLKPIYSKTGELSGQWHRQCFICSSPECSIQFSKHVQCYVFGDHPYCFEHYHILNNSVCKSCNVGIEGQCISNELDEKWHLQCLNCSSCGNGIRSDYFIINGNGIMCSSCKQNNAGLSVSDRIEKRRTRIYNV